jgi:predicted PurR-regulated permease PerM
MDPSTGAARREFAWRAVIAIVLVALGALIWYAARVFLITFAGILLAVFLSFLGDRLSDLTGIGRGKAFAVVAVGISLLLSMAGWIAFPHIADQMDQLIRSIPSAFQSVRKYLEGREWGQALLRYLPTALASANIAGKITAALKTAIVDLTGLLIVAVIALYMGASPDLYERGLLALFPRERRARARDVFLEVAYTLRWWEIGQLVPMCVLGIATGIGLWLLDVHLAFTLALFTAFMIFIPFIGSVIALIVTSLVALMQSPELAFYVVLLFIGIHTAEGYLLTPLVQRRAVYLPPALTIISQVLMSVLFGFIGLALATPITAASLVLVKMLYLHERPEHHK